MTSPAQPLRLAPTCNNGLEPKWLRSDGVVSGELLPCSASEGRVPDKFQTNSRQIPDKFQTNSRVWKSLGNSGKFGVWNFPDFSRLSQTLEFVCNVSGMCLEFVWNLSGLGQANPRLTDPNKCVLLTGAGLGPKILYPHPYPYPYRDPYPCP